MQRIRPRSIKLPMLAPTAVDALLALLTDRLGAVVGGTVPNVWRGVTLAATDDQSLVLADPLPATPLAEPLILYPDDCPVGTLADAFYWSRDGGETARWPREGDFLYVNPSFFGGPISAGDRLTIIYFSLTSNNSNFMVIPKRALGTLGLTGADIVDNSITSAKIQDGTVAAADLANNSVGSAAIIDNSIANADMGAAAVGLSNIAAAAVASIKGGGKTANWVALACSTDGAKASNSTLPETPLAGTINFVVVNGVPQFVGDGVKTTDCYFSADSGATAKTLANIVLGDALYLNCVIGGMTTLAGDQIWVPYRL